MISIRPNFVCMSMHVKCHQILFFFATVLISKKTVASSQIQVTVILSDASLKHTTPMKQLFEAIPSFPGKEVHFGYKYMNSSFCDIGTLLSFLNGVLPCEIVVLMLDTCDCERSFMPYLFMLRVKVVSSCEETLSDITWKSITAWNSNTLQPCSYQEQRSNIIHQNTLKKFRVPIVEYFPFIVKHEFRSYYTSCPANSLVCYGQRDTVGNATVIDYTEYFCCTGWTVDVLEYLANKLLCEFELYFQAGGQYGLYDDEIGTWTGVIQDLLSGKGDIAVDLVIRPDRCTALDCTLGYLFDGYNAITRLVVSEENRYNNKDSFHALVGNFQIFLSPFHLDLLVTVLMIFNVFLFLIWAADKICLSFRNKRPGKKKEKFTLLESTSYVWATAFGRDVGNSKKPLTLSARYLSSWLAFLSLIFVNVYVARLMAEIVKQDATKPFTSLRDREILNKNLKLGVVRGSAMEAYFHNTRDPVLVKTFENIQENLLPSLDYGVEAVKNGILDGFIADTISLTAVINDDPNCSLSLVGQDFVTIPVGFMFRKDWPWAEEFKLQELDMNENKRNTDLWQARQTLPTCELPTKAHAQLSISDMSGLFLVLIFAIAYCACVSLVAESMLSSLLYRYQRSNVRWKVPRKHTRNASASGASVNHMVRARQSKTAT